MTNQDVFEQKRTAQTGAILRVIDVRCARVAFSQVDGDWNVELLGERPIRIDPLVAGRDADILIRDFAQDLEVAGFDMATQGVRGEGVFTTELQLISRDKPARRCLLEGRKVLSV